MMKLDIAICGCGPAGLATAILLHRQGHRVTVFERFAEPQPVGSGLILQPTGLGVLDHLGLLNQVIKHGARIDRLYGEVMPSQRAILDVHYSALGEDWHGLAVHRATLFECLFNAARAENIRVVFDTAIAQGMEGVRTSLVGSNSTVLGQFDLVVNAMGSNSPLMPARVKRNLLPYGALWVNVSLSDNAIRPAMLQQRYFKASHMAGILPIGTLPNSTQPLAAIFWSLRRRDYDQWKNSGLDVWREQVASLWPEAATMLRSIKSLDEVTFARYDHFTQRTPYQHGIVHIGDAAHSTSPQLGQGANMALLDAMALSLAIEESKSIVDAMRRYTQLRSAHVKLFQLASQLFTPMYQSDSNILPWLRDTIAAPLSRLSIMQRLLARLVTGLTIQPLRGKSFVPAKITSLHKHHSE